MSFLTREKRCEIEAAAGQQLQDYYRDHPRQARVPVPIEHMIEFHLGLALLFKDLKLELGHEAILGALCLNPCEIWVDRSLDPEEAPHLEGRYRFTLAHEIGHWCLHRFARPRQHFLTSLENQCESTIEREADAFAAALLMPGIEVWSSWKSQFGEARVALRDLIPFGDQILKEESARRRYLPRGKEEARNFLLEWSVVRLAEQFRVSPAAMRIRCEQFGLVLR